MIKITILAVFCSIVTAFTALAQTPPSPNELETYSGFHAAVARGDIEAVERYVNEYRDINARDSRGRTPVMVAAYFQDLEIARVLIKAGADLNLLDYQAYDMLTISGVLNDVAMVKLAIEHGANVKLVTSPYDGTALIASAHLGHDDVVAEFIKAGAPLDHVNNIQWTALIEAIVLGDGGPHHVACVRLLVDAGANVNLADGNGRSPLSLALERGYTKMADILKDAGASP